MYLKRIKIWNFRCYGSKSNNEPGIEIDFDPKLNLLIGANDSGKTAIIDAIRHVLGTQTYDAIRFEDEDFHEENNQRATELKIECIFSGFNETEAGQFLEWINIDKEDIKKSELRVWLTAQRKNNRIVTNLRAGYDDEGQYLEGEARDLLGVIVLPPESTTTSPLSHPKSADQGLKRYIRSLHYSWTLILFFSFCTLSLACLLIVVFLFLFYKVKIRRFYFPDLRLNFHNL